MNFIIKVYHMLVHGACWGCGKMWINTGLHCNSCKSERGESLLGYVQSSAYKRRL